MEQYTFFFYLVSLSTGILSIGISTGIYLHYRRKALLYYILFLVSLSLIITSLSIVRFRAFVSASYFTRLFSPTDILGFTGLLMVMAVLPPFLHSLIARPYPAAKRIAFPALVVVQAVLIAFAGMYDRFSIFLAIPFVSVFVYCLVLIGVSFKKIGNRTLRSGVAVFFALSLSYFPVNIIEMIRDRYPAINLPEGFELFTLPLYFFALNLFSIAFAVFFFNRPAYFEGSEITGHFRKRFGISQRESEIIDAIVAGLKSEEIADKLFISTKTVNNHVYNIFQKTGVKTRVQLVNLLMTSRIGT
jgi:DNA-binding CsgD family transcriptional regulator